MAKYTIELEKPVGVTHEEMMDYIETEVCAGVGGMDPGEPIAKLNRDSVAVSKAREVQPTRCAPGLTKKRAEDFLKGYNREAPKGRGSVAYHEGFVANKGK